MDAIIGRGEVPTQDFGMSPMKKSGTPASLLMERY